MYGPDEGQSSGQRVYGGSGGYGHRETGQFGGKWSQGKVDGGDWDGVGCCLVGWVGCWYLFGINM